MGYSINLIVNKKIGACYYNIKIDKQGNFKGHWFFHIKDQVDIVKEGQLI